MGIGGIEIVEGDEVEEDVLKYGFILEGVLGIWGGATTSKLTFYRMRGGIGGGSTC